MIFEKPPTVYPDHHGSNNQSDRLRNQLGDLDDLFNNEPSRGGVDAGAQLPPYGIPTGVGDIPLGEGPNVVKKVMPFGDAPEQTEANGFKSEENAAASPTDGGEKEEQATSQAVPAATL